jgi:hypothetical protein
MRLLPGLAVTIAVALILIGCASATLPIRDDRDKNNAVARVSSPAPKSKPSTGSTGG